MRLSAEVPNKNRKESRKGERTEQMRERMFNNCKHEFVCFVLIVAVSVQSATLDLAQENKD